LALPIKALKMKIKAKVVKKKMKVAALPNEEKLVPTVVGFERVLAAVRTSYFLASASC